MVRRTICSTLMRSQQAEDAMKIATAQTSGICIVRVQGSINVTTSTTLDHALSALLLARKTKLLLNLEDVDYISSAGLRVLLRTFGRLKDSGGTMRVCSASSFVKEVMELCALDRVIRVLPTEQLAVESMLA